MKTRKRRILLWTVGIFAALAITIAFYYERLVLKFILPDLEHIRVAEIEFRSDSVHLRVDLSMRNKGFWKVEWLKTNLKIYDDTTLLMSYSNDSIQTVERNGVCTTTLYLTLPLSKIVNRIKAHQGEDSAAVRITGNVEWSSILGDVNSAVDIDYQLRVPVPPQVRFTSMAYGKADEKNEYDVLCNLMIVNRNPRELVLDSVTYVLSGSKFGEVHGFLPQVFIAAADCTYIQAPGRAHIQNKFGLIARIILDKDVVDYSFVLKGRLMHFTGLKAENVPLTIISTGTIELYREEAERKIEITRLPK